MNTLTFIKTATILSVGSLFLAGCTQSTTSTNVAPSNDIDPGMYAKSTIQPQMTPTPGQSNSTETEDLKKELDNTKIDTENFNDIK